MGPITKNLMIRIRICCVCAVCYLYMSTDTHHSCNLIKRLKEFYNFRLVGRFNSSETARIQAGFSLGWRTELIKLTTCAVTSSSCPKMPMRRQMATAVPLLSPVIMMTLMPACRHSFTEEATSILGGSSMPTQPTKVRLVYGERITLCQNRKFWVFLPLVCRVQVSAFSNGKIHTTDVNINPMKNSINSNKSEAKLSLHSCY